MDRQRFKELLLAKIKEGEERVDQLRQEKTMAEGPRSSWSSRIHLDLEEQITQWQKQTATVRAILRILNTSGSSSTIQLGSLVSLSIDNESEEHYFLVDCDGDLGGEIGEYFVLSRKTPVGEAIWGKTTGEQVNAQVPAGQVIVRILTVA